LVEQNYRLGSYLGMSSFLVKYIAVSVINCKISEGIGKLSRDILIVFKVNPVFSLEILEYCSPSKCLGL
jgi:hypothetical protein